MHYLALGDSITYGHSLKTKAAPFPYHVQAALSKREQVHLQLHARPGWSSDQLLRSLCKSGNLNQESKRLATVIIGGNDLIKYTLSILTGKTDSLHKRVEHLCENIESIIDVIDRPQTIIMIGTLYNPFPNWSVMEEVIRLVNHRIRAFAQLNRLQLLDLERLFKGTEDQHIDGYRRGRLFDVRPIGNPIHPNISGHLPIAQEVVRVYDFTANSAVRAAEQAHAVIGT